MNASDPTEWAKLLVELATLQQEDELAFENPAEAFRRGWRDMLEANTIPASKLLNALRDEKEPSI